MRRGPVVEISARHSTEQLALAAYNPAYEDVLRLGILPQELSTQRARPHLAMLADSSSARLRNPVNTIIVAQQSELAAYYVPAPYLTDPEASSRFKGWTALVTLRGIARCTISDGRRFYDTELMQGRAVYMEYGSLYAMSPPVGREPLTTVFMGYDPSKNA